MDNCIVVYLPQFSYISLLISKLNQLFPVSTKIFVAKNEADVSRMAKKYPFMQKLFVLPFELYHQKRKDISHCRVMTVGDFSYNEYDGLDGVSDFVFSNATVEEIVFRIGKILNKKFRIFNEGIEFFLSKNFVEVNKRRIYLSLIELSLFRILFLQSGKWFSAKQLSLMLENKIGEASISVIISRLRAKLGCFGKFLMTQRGVGYSFVLKE